MPDHNTRQTTTIHFMHGQIILAQNHTTLAQAQTAMNNKIDSILE